MVTTEKLSWIQKNLIRGEKAEIAKTTEIAYSVVTDIIKGKLWGEHGETVIAAAEKMINTRLKRQAKEKKKYANANHGMQ